MDAEARDRDQKGAGTDRFAFGVEISGWPPDNVEEFSKQFQTIFFKKVDELELSVRTANCLKYDNIIYIGDLVQKSEEEMLRTQVRSQVTQRDCGDTGGDGSAARRGSCGLAAGERRGTFQRP